MTTHGGTLLIVNSSYSDLIFYRLPNGLISDSNNLHILEFHKTDANIPPHNLLYYYHLNLGSSY